MVEKKDDDQTIKLGVDSKACPPVTIAELHARVAVLEQQIIDQKDATRLALAAADKAIVNAVVVADKAVAKVELAAEKTYLEAAISSLKDAFSQQISFQKDLTQQALNSADKAVAKAEDAAEKRFESVNEFRSTLSDQQRDLATKTEVNLKFDALEERINTLVADAREIKGRQSVSDPEMANTVRLLAAKITDLSTSRDQLTGRDKLSTDNSARMMAILAIAAAAVVALAELMTRMSVH